MEQDSPHTEPSSGALLRESLSMAWPAVLESFFVSLAAMIDVMMVSSLGPQAVAAIGLTTQPKLLGLGIFLSINVAVSALVARRRGQNDRKNANEVLVTAFLVSVLGCAAVSLLCVLFAGQILDLCGSQPDTHDNAALYFRIIMGGLMFNVISLCINAAQRGCGKTRIAMTTNITSSVVNMCGNYLLIGGHLGFPALGVLGAALATVFGSAVAACMSIISLLPENGFVSLPYLLKEKLTPRVGTLKNLFSISGNIMAENVLMRIGFLFTAVMAAKLGTAAFAAHQVGMNTLALAFSFGDGMQVAAVALIGRSLGQEKPALARRYGNICQKIGMAISICLALLLVLFGRRFYMLYFEDAAIIEMGVLIMRFMAVIVLVQISQVIFTGCLRGAGDVRYTLVASMVSVTIVRSVVTWVAVDILGLGLTGIWIGILCDQVSRFCTMGLRFRSGTWTKLKI